MINSAIFKVLNRSKYTWYFIIIIIIPLSYLQYVAHAMARRFYLPEAFKAFQGFEDVTHRMVIVTH